MLAAKNKAVEVLEEAKKEEKKRQEQIFRLEKRLEIAEENLDRKLDELEKEKRPLIRKAEEIKKIRKETEAARQEQLKRLEKIAGLSKEEAKKILLQLAEEQNQRNFGRANEENGAAKGRKSSKKRRANIMTSGDAEICRKPCRGNNHFNRRHPFG